MNIGAGLYFFFVIFRVNFIYLLLQPALSFTSPFMRTFIVAFAYLNPFSHITEGGVSPF